MKIVTFVETCEVLLRNEYDFFETHYSVPRTFFSGDEAEVDHIKDVDTRLRTSPL